MVYRGTQLTYAGLAAAVRAVAAGLGPRPGTVAVPATHHPDTVVGLLGVWAAGGTYCPIDPALPAERRRMMFEDAGCATTLGPADPASPANPGDPVRTDPHDPAYTLFT